MNQKHFDFASQMTRLIDRFESTILNHLKRLEERLTQIANQGSRTSDRTCGNSVVEKFHSQTDALSQLQVDGQRLIAAWAELESQQRQLLASRSISNIANQLSQPSPNISKLATTLPKRLNDQRPQALTSARNTAANSAEQFAKIKLRAAVRSFGRK